MNKPRPNTLLAVDTSTRTAGLAVYDGLQVLCESTWSSQDFHTVKLAPAVQENLALLGIKMNELGAIAVAIGPGSFTGLRIGLALAKGLALGLRLPLVGVPTLDALAAAQPVSAASLAAVLRAGRGRLAVGWYQPAGESWRSTGQIEVLTAAELLEKIETPTFLCGELDEDERRLLARKRRLLKLASPAQSLRRPSFLAELAWKSWQAGQVSDPATLTPIYLHYNMPSPSPEGLQ